MFENLANITFNLKEILDFKYSIKLFSKTL